MERAKVRAAFFFTILILLSRVLLSQTEVLYEYDSEGQLVKAEYSDGFTLRYSYDPAGNLASRQVERTGSRLLFPFYQAGDRTFVGFAFSNYSAASAEMELTAFDSEGTLLGSHRNPSRLFLPAGSQMALLGSELFELDMSRERSAWIELVSDTSHLGSFFLFGDLNLTRLDGAPATVEPEPVLYFTRIYEGPAAFYGRPAITMLSLANPNDSPLEIELTLYGKRSATPGDYVVSRLGQETFHLNPRGYLYGSVSELLGSWVSGGYVIAEVQGVSTSRPRGAPPGLGIAGFELVQLIEVQTVLGLAGAKRAPQESKTSLYAAQVSESDGLFTDLTLVNTNTGTANIHLQFSEGCRWSECGSDQLRLRWSGSLKPGEMLQERFRDLALIDESTGREFDREKYSEFSGFLEVTSNGMTIGDTVFGDPVGHRFAAATPLQEDLYQKAVLSHVANSPEYFTGLAFVNPAWGGAENAADITVKVHGADGSVVGEVSFELYPRERTAKQIPEWIPEASNHVGGFIEVEASKPIILQQIFGERTLKMFSTIPPTVVEESQ